MVFHLPCKGINGSQTIEMYPHTFRHKFYLNFYENKRLEDTLNNITTQRQSISGVFFISTRQFMKVQVFEIMGF